MQSQCHLFILQLDPGISECYASLPSAFQLRVTALCITIGLPHGGLARSGGKCHPRIAYDDGSQKPFVVDSPVING